MHAIWSYNRRGIVHEWTVTAVTGYWQAKCDRRMQSHESNLQRSDADLWNMPRCQRCFPGHVRKPVSI